VCGPNRGGWDDPEAYHYIAMSGGAALAASFDTDDSTAVENYEIAVTLTMVE